MTISAQLPQVRAGLSLADSREHCRQITKSHARNFYHGMKLVPEPRKSAMFALYAWMRQADDLADAPGDLHAKRGALDRLRRDTHAVIEGGDAPGEIWPAFGEMARTYCVPTEYFDAMIDGLLLDQSSTRYRTFEELYDYCYKVASVVGLACIQIWGYEGGEQTRKLAEWRGIAFQLTNILRDVAEDARRDRVYLPAEDFGAFTVNPSMFTLGKPGDIAPALAKTVARAREFYEKSAPLNALVATPGRACLWAMTRIYRGLLDKIEPDPTIVLRQRVALSGLRKAWIAVRAMLGDGQ